MAEISMAEIMRRCEPDGDCQVWQFSVSIDGRPMWPHRGGKRPPVRRLVWELQNCCPMPAGRRACAACETPLCVIHVVALTQSELLWRASARGRLGGPKHAASVSIARRRMSKIMSAEKAALIRLRRDEGATYSQLGAEFGVNQSTAHDICTGESWAPISGASAFTYRP